MDKYSYRIIVATIASAAIVSTIGSIILAFAGRDVPEHLMTIGVTAFGMLGSLLVPTPR